MHESRFRSYRIWNTQKHRLKTVTSSRCVITADYRTTGALLLVCWGADSELGTPSSHSMSSRGCELSDHAKSIGFTTGSMLVTVLLLNMVQCFKCDPNLHIFEALRTPLQLGQECGLSVVMSVIEGASAPIWGKMSDDGVSVAPPEPESTVTGPKELTLFDPMTVFPASCDPRPTMPLPVLTSIVLQAIFVWRSSRLNPAKA